MVSECIFNISLKIDLILKSLYSQWRLFDRRNKTKTVFQKQKNFKNPSIGELSDFEIFFGFEGLF